jgi:hypothetical protein
MRPVRYPSSLLQMLRQDRRAATAADAQQAERWRDWLVYERCALSLQLSKQTRHYEQWATSVSAHRLSHLRRSIGSTENEIRTIDHMIDALARRFTDEIPTLRRA